MTQKAPASQKGGAFCVWTTLFIGIFVTNLTEKADLF